MYRLVAKFLGSTWARAKWVDTVDVKLYHRGAAAAIYAERSDRGKGNVGSSIRGHGHDSIGSVLTPVKGDTPDAYVCDHRQHMCWIITIFLPASVACHEREKAPRRQKCVCLHICVCICLYICHCVCTHVCMIVCVYVRVCMYVCVCAYVCIYVCMSVCIYVCPVRFGVFWAFFGQKTPKRIGTTSLGSPGLSSQSVLGLL